MGEKRCGERGEEEKKGGRTGNGGRDGSNKVGGPGVRRSCGPLLLVETRLLMKAAGTHIGCFVAHSLVPDEICSEKAHSNVSSIKPKFRVYSILGLIQYCSSVTKLGIFSSNVKVPASANLTTYQIG